jgi:glycosyltransferase involved in cell wall biosynthesis
MLVENPNVSSAPPPERPRVSVCIPTFNGAKHIRECLDSVLAQTFREFEILIVEDGSRDETPDIVAEYARRDPRIRVVRNDRNMGLVENWNRCVELSQGRYIKFAFQDDVLFPDCLLRLMQLAATGKPIVFCSRELWFDSEIGQAVRDEYERLPTLRRLFAGATEVSAEDLISMVMDRPINFFGEPTTVLLDRTLFNRFGGFNPALVHHSDFEYWVRVGIHTGLGFTPESLAAFRLHPSSTSSVNRTRSFRAEYLDELILMHEYAYNPCYRPLRQALERASRNPKKELAVKAEWLRAVAMRAATSGEPHLLSEWDKVATAFPRIRWTAYHLPIRARAWLERHVAWRFRAGRSEHPGTDL